MFRSSLMWIILLGLSTAAYGQFGPFTEQLGTQEFRHLAPEDLQAGFVQFAGKMVSRDGDSFTFFPESAWGTFHYEFTFVNGTPNEQLPKVVNEKSPQVDSTYIPLADVEKIGEKQQLVLHGRISTIEEGGTAFKAFVVFSGQTNEYAVKLIQQERGGPKPAPTKHNLRYGAHWRQVIDFYAATSDKPTPLVCFIHGGGWVNGDKSGINSGLIKAMHDAGISVAAINYRFVPEATDQGVNPPVRWPLYDAARALQFLRHHAAELNFDKTKVGATGGSAGACTSLWLAYHDNLADPTSPNLIARESTRLTCAAVAGAQTTLDPAQMKEWMPNSRYGGHAFGFRKPGQGRDTVFDEFLENREKLLPWIRDYSPFELVTPDDPPVMLTYDGQKDPVVKGTPQSDPTHSALFGVLLKQKTDAMGIECVVTWPEHKAEKYASANQFLIDHLTK